MAEKRAGRFRRARPFRRRARFHAGAGKLGVASIDHSQDERLKR
jgi:hypothetical protein